MTSSPDSPDEGAENPVDTAVLAALRSAVRRSAGVSEAEPLAARLLRAVTGIVASDSAAVLVGGPTACHQLAMEGRAAVDWAAELEFADDAWGSADPRLRDSAVGDPGRSAVILPLRGAGPTFGLVALLRDPPYPSGAVAAAAAAVRTFATRLEIALLFDDLRAAATADERRWVARETHDGVAQELATLGYRLDGLTSDAEVSAPALAPELRALRLSLSGVVRELRHTISDLRTGAEGASSLGAALGSYTRAVSAAAAIPVHLRIEEGPTRLSPNTETELLRIAQEAVTNARRHSGAANLWVTCRIAPPAALLRIEDDGSGAAESRRSDSFGLDIIRERALRLGASLTIRERLPHGTLVEVILGDRLGDVSGGTG